MPSGKDKKNEKHLPPKGLLSRILEVFEGHVVSEIEEKKLNKAITKHSRSLEKERKQIKERLKAVQSHWDDIDKESDSWHN